MMLSKYLLETKLCVTYMRTMLFSPLCNLFSWVLYYDHILTILCPIYVCIIYIHISDILCVYYVYVYTRCIEQKYTVRKRSPKWKFYYVQEISLCTLVEDGLLLLLAL